jgi:hypothetical protein
MIRSRGRAILEHGRLIETRGGDQRDLGHDVGGARDDGKEVAGQSELRAPLLDPGEGIVMARRVTGP